MVIGTCPKPIVAVRSFATASTNEKSPNPKPSLRHFSLFTRWRKAPWRLVFSRMSIADIGYLENITVTRQRTDNVLHKRGVRNSEMLSHVKLVTYQGESVATAN